MPKINHYRDHQLLGNQKAGKTFNVLHRLSVVINLAQMWIIGFVLYKVPFGIPGDLVGGGWVRKDLENIFTYRQKTIETLLAH
jgi:hypothetical protein